MMRGPGGKNDGPVCGADHCINIVFCEAVCHLVAKLAHCARVGIDRVLVDVGIGVEARSENKVACSKRADILEHSQHFAFIHNSPIVTRPT